MILIRKLLSASLILLAAIMLAGFFLFNHFFINSASELDSKTPEQQEEALVSSEEFKDLEEVSALKEQVELMEDGKGAVAVTESAASDSVVTVPSKTSIENGLRAKLIALQSEYTGKLNRLVGQAKAEYVQICSGKTRIGLDELARKYISIGSALESQCDARVYAAIAYAENQLVYYNYESSIPNQAREQYQTAKAQRRKAMLSSIR